MTSTAEARRFRREFIEQTVTLHDARTDRGLRSIVQQIADAWERSLEGVAEEARDRGYREGRSAGYDSGFADGQENAF